MISCTVITRVCTYLVPYVSYLSHTSLVPRGGVWARHEIHRELQFGKVVVKIVHAHAHCITVDFSDLGGGERLT